MTTENGLPHTSKVGAYIRRIQRRLDYVTDCIAEDIDDGCKPNPYDVAEAEALQWAIPVLEAEWDNVRRLNKNLEHVTNRLKALDKQHAGDDMRSAPIWDPPETTTSKDRT